jgi:hypothetical protein
MGLLCYRWSYLVAGGNADRAANALVQRCDVVPSNARGMSMMRATIVEDADHRGVAPGENASDAAAATPVSARRRLIHKD